MVKFRLERKPIMTTTETTFVSSSFSCKLRLDKACESAANEKMSDQIFDSC